MSDNDEIHEVTDAELESTMSNDDSSHKDPLGDDDDDTDLSDTGLSDTELTDSEIDVDKDNINIPSKMGNTINTTSNKSLSTELPSAELTSNTILNINPTSKLKMYEEKKDEEEAEDDSEEEEDEDDSEEEADEDDSEEEADEDDSEEEESKDDNSLPITKKTNLPPVVYTDSSDDEDSTFDNKFEIENINNYLINFHPESKQHNYDEIYALSKVTRNKDGVIIDKLHRTSPMLSKYEKTRILGQRAKQINSGNKPLINVDRSVLDGYLIAEEELKQKKIPFIIRRPLPSGASEYWRVSDLEILN